MAIQAYFHRIATSFACFSILIPLFTSGCATTIAAIHLIDGTWPTSGGTEHHEWLNGAPNRVLTVEARLTTPPRIICHTAVEEPAAEITHETFGLDTGGRIAIGFIGLSEMAFGILPLVLPDPDGHVTPAWKAVATYVAIDGLAALILAAAIPDTYRKEVVYREAQAYTTDICPFGLMFTLGQESFPIGSDGYLSPADSTYVMTQVVETGMPIGLRNGDDVRMTEVPPDIRCTWALHLKHPAERALCPQAPVVVPVPVYPVPPPPPPRPPVYRPVPR